MADLQEAVEPLLFGLIPPVSIVSAAMAVLIGVMLHECFLEIDATPPHR